MADYICKHCKFNNNGWCVAKKVNGLKKIIECDDFVRGKYGEFESKKSSSTRIINYKIRWQRKDRSSDEDVFMHQFKTEKEAREQGEFLKNCTGIYENVKVFKCTTFEEEI